MTVALCYIRRSVIKVGDKTDSPEKQRAACELICREKGWLPEWFQDAEEGHHYSGRSEENRPAWLRLKSQLVRPDVAAVVVASLDRASRSPKDFFAFLDELRTRDIALVSAKEQFDTSTAIGRAFLAILMVIASLEADMASERIQATILFRQNSGLHWGYTPFGYTRNGDSTLVPSEDAPLVGQVYELYAGGQRSYLDISQHLNGAGQRILDRSGNRRLFMEEDVRMLIRSHWLYRGWLIPKSERRLSRYEHDETIPPPGAVRGQFPPLVPEELAVRVCDALNRRTELAPKRLTDRVYLLTPVLHCEQCGAGLRGMTSREGSYYRHRGKTCQRGLSWCPADPLESQMLELLGCFQIPPAWRPDLEVLLAERQHQPEVRDITSQVERLRGSISRLRDTYIYGDTTLEEYDRERHRMLGEIERLQKGQGGQGYDLGQMLDMLASLGSRVAAADPQTQKELIGLLFSSIGAGRNELGEWVIMSATPRDLFQAFFGDLKRCCHLRHEGYSRPLVAASLAKLLQLVRPCS